MQRMGGTESIVPAATFMVDWMRGTAEDSGMYVGILASSYFWGQFIASFIWPPLSDRIGRKKSLIWGQLALTLPFIGFAFSYFNADIRIRYVSASSPVFHRMCVSSSSS